MKSAVGLGILLAEGIGDTLRVSLTADPVEEVLVGWEILAALDIRRSHPELVSCPTCGRCEVDLIPIAEEVERRLRERRTPIKVAVMGCVVNGPGEAREADIGVAAGKGVGLDLREGRAAAQGPRGPRSSTRCSRRSTGWSASWQAARRRETGGGTLSTRRLPRRVRRRARETPSSPRPRYSRPVRLSLGRNAP